MKKRLLCAVIALLCVLASAAGCTRQESQEGDTSNNAGGIVTTPNNETVTSASPLDASSVFTSRDLSGKYDADSAVPLTLNGETVTVTEAGTYILTGTIKGGQIIVEASKSDKIQLVLAGVNVSCDNSAAIYVKSADKVFITLAEGSENTLSTTGEFVADGDVNVDGVIFARDDITINGSGSLTVTTASGHGIVGKDDVKITGGTVTVNASKHAITGKDSVSIADGKLTLTSGKDGIHSENSDDASRGNILIIGGSVKIVSDGDGIDGSGTVEIEGGTLDIVSGGGHENGEAHNDENFGGGRFGGFGRASSDTSSDSVSTKGVKADAQLIVTGGEITIDSADDALHCNGIISVSGGKITAATGDDGIHSDTTVSIEAGEVTITESYEGIEGAVILISGGVIDVKASDDGINASDGTGDEMGGGGFGGGGFGGFGGGGRPDGGRGNGGRGNAGGNVPSDGNMGGMPNGNMGDVPDGNMGGIPDGDPGDVPDDAPNGTPDGVPGDMPDGTPDGNLGGTAITSSIYINISGGKIHIDAGGDGIDSNGSLYVSGGEIYVDGPENSGNGALDYATDAVITGGVIVAVGDSGMAVNFGSSSTQGSILATIRSRVTGEVTLTDKSGNVIASFTPSGSYNSVVVSAPGIKSGETYTLSAGDTTTEIKMTSLIYGSGSSGGFGGHMR